MEDVMFIGVSGLIGVGKTTLTSSLAGALGYKTCFEPVEENPYLEDFYDDMERWTFNMQLYLLAERFRLHQEVIWNPCHQAGGGIVQDRTIYEDTIFARMHQEDGLMSKRDFDVYLHHFEIMKRFLVYPDIIIYLRVSPEVAMERIKSRGRHAEEGMEMSYLQRLYDGYEEFAEEMERYTVVLPLEWGDPQAQAADLAATVIDAVSEHHKFIRSLRRI